ncbi:preprotein translocase subunit SecG [Thioflexithrix psekupsensis]|uniref:Protein-export membrane protein SecG n=1 Tax=Thioflexithrix psekupsensis TaxID=1570016 RepID=A0A251XA04_9GAMM|nr:preprotein translocase subunit SecG [Thioflexithrix psekupsensis]OUD14624.1 preprotein translocase subunit SecG [Thioflexithrix psekupsensis]
MHTILVIVQIMVCASLIGLILIQHGKGADMGAAFGSGASATVFGSRGSASFLTRTTAGLAAAFFILSLVLAYFSTGQREPRSVLESVTVQTQPATELPATTAVPSPTSEELPTVQEETTAERTTENATTVTVETNTQPVESPAENSVVTETSPVIQEQTPDPSAATEEKTQ